MSLPTTTIEIIQTIAKKLAHKYTFGYYDVEDIQQEAFMIGMEALPRYREADGSLASFLYIHISNRLKNFKRDNYYRHSYECAHCGGTDAREACDYCRRREWRVAAKRHIMEPMDIDNIHSDREPRLAEQNNVVADAECREISSIIDDNLEIAFREDYLRMRDGAYVPRARREAIEARITEILNEHGI